MKRIGSFATGLSIGLALAATAALAVVAVPFIDATTGYLNVGTVIGTSESVTLSSNIYAATAADCGKVKLLPTGTTPSVTLPNLNQDCTIVFITTVAKSYLFNVASGGSKQNSQAFFNSRGSNAGDTVSATITVKSSSAATWNVAGDLTS